MHIQLSDRADERMTVRQKMKEVANQQTKRRWVNMRERGLSGAKGECVLRQLGVSAATEPCQSCNRSSRVTLSYPASVSFNTNELNGCIIVEAKDVFVFDVDKQMYQPPKSLRKLFDSLSGHNTTLRKQWEGIQTLSAENSHSHNRSVVITSSEVST